MSIQTSACPVCGAQEGLSDTEIHPRYSLAECWMCESLLHVEVDVDQEGERMTVYLEPTGHVYRLGVAL